MGTAVSVAEVSGAGAGLALLGELDLPGHRLSAARAALLSRSGRGAEATVAYDEAIARCDNDAERRHLLRRRSATA